MLLLTVSMVLSGLPLFAQEAQAGLSNKGALQAHTPIVIASDAGFTVGNGVRYGDGSASKPYVIENWSIELNLYAANNGISISGTSKCFMIRNCYISNSSTSYYGIAISNAVTSPFAIVNCYLYSNDVNIGIWGVSGNQLPQDFTIRNCSFNKTLASVPPMGRHIWTAYTKGTIKIENCDFKDANTDSISLWSSMKVAIIRNCTSTGNPVYGHISMADNSGSNPIGKLEIDNCTLNGGQTTCKSIYILTVGPGGNISNVKINNNLGSGIYLQNQAKYNITDCSLTTIGGNALYLTSCQDIHANNVTVLKSGTGIGILSSDRTIISNSTIAGCTDVAGTYPAGIQIVGSISPKVIGCHLYGKVSGLYTQGGNYFFISNNTINDTRSTTDVRGASVYMNGGLGHEYYNNTLTNGSYGMYIIGTNGFKIHKNWITKMNNNGFYVTDSATKSVIYGNYVYNNTKNVTDLDTNIPPENHWNETYANGGGNFWGNHSGIDAKKGALQNIAGKDGIGDFPYIIKGRINDSYPLMFLPDHTPPTSSVSAMPFWHNAPFLVPFTAADNTWLTSIGLQYKYSSDNTSFGPWTLYTTLALSENAEKGNFSFTPPSGDGYYRFQTNATDGPGLKEAALPALYDAVAGYDTATPQSNVKALSAQTTMTVFNVSYQATDGLSGIHSVELWVCNSTNGTTFGTYALYGTKTYPALTNFTFSGEIGTYYRFYTRAYDNISNYEAAPALNDTGVFIIETVNPVTTLVVKTPKFGTDPLYVSSITHFNLTAVDMGIGLDHIWYSFNGTSTYHVYSGEFTCAPFVTYILYGAVDRLGNNETARRKNVSIDDAAPVTTLTRSGPQFGASPLNVTSATEFHLGATDAGSGVALIRYRVDTGAWSTFTGNFTIATAGLHIVSFNATDKLGNAELTKVFSVFVDDIAPVTVLSIGLPKSGTDPVDVTSDTEFNLTASDNRVGVAKLEYRVDTGAWMTYGGNFSIAALGLHKIYYNATDSLGNAESAKNRSIEVITLTPPPMPNPNVTGQVTYSGGPLDGQNSANATVEITFNSTVLGSKDIGTDGSYAISVPIGVNYTLTVAPATEVAGVVGSKSGYLGQSHTINVSANLTEDIALEYYTYTPITPPPVKKPTLTITAPSEKASFEVDVNITVTGTSTDLTAGTQVNITLNGVTWTTTTATAGGWSLTVKAPSTAGNYTISAVASTASDLVNITVKAKTVPVDDDVDDDADDDTGDEKGILDYWWVFLIILLLVIGIIIAVVLMRKKKSEEEEPAKGEEDEEEAAKEEGSEEDADEEEKTAAGEDKEDAGEEEDEDKEKEEGSGEDEKEEKEDEADDDDAHGEEGSEEDTDDEWEKVDGEEGPAEEGSEKGSGKAEKTAAGEEEDAEDEWSEEPDEDTGDDAATDIEAEEKE